jgi:hypothetical protein
MTAQRIRFNIRQAKRIITFNTYGCDEPTVTIQLSSEEYKSLMRCLDTAVEAAQYTQPSMLSDSEGSPLFSIGA